MEESIKCECGNTKFWYFGKFVRCPNCLNEFKSTGNFDGFDDKNELWMRRFNHEEHKYNPNWEK